MMQLGPQKLCPLEIAMLEEQLAEIEIKRRDPLLTFAEQSALGWERRQVLKQLNGA